MSKTVHQQLLSHFVLKPEERITNRTLCDTLEKPFIDGNFICASGLKTMIMIPSDIIDFDYAKEKYDPFESKVWSGELNVLGVMITDKLSKDILSLPQSHQTICSYCDGDKYVKEGITKHKCYACGAKGYMTIDEIDPSSKIRIFDNLFNPNFIKNHLLYTAHCLKSETIELVFHKKHLNHNVFRINNVYVIINPLQYELRIQSQFRYLQNVDIYENSLHYSKYLKNVTQ